MSRLVWGSLAGLMVAMALLSACAQQPEPETFAVTYYYLPG